MISHGARLSMNNKNVYRELRYFICFNQHSDNLHMETQGLVLSCVISKKNGLKKT